MPHYQIKAIGEYKFYLVMNLMRDKAESQRHFGPFETKEALITWYNGEKVEPYEEESPNGFDGANQKFHKVFRKKGPLEWMNPLEEHEFEHPGLFGHGIYEMLENVTDVVRGAAVL